MRRSPAATSTWWPGKTWPDGDPFLQRQNEPSIAASTRNPLHLLGGSNDYRTIDLPGLPDEDEDETGDAWLGLFKSVDGGQRWKSDLLPGYPQDDYEPAKVSPHRWIGVRSRRRPGRARRHQRAAVLQRASCSIAHSSTTGKSAIFVSRFLDENNQEAGDPITYLGTSLVARSDGVRRRLPRQAVDGGRLCRAAAPRANATIPLPAKIRRTAETKPKTQKLDIGNIYVAYTSIIGDGDALRSVIYLHVSERLRQLVGQAAAAQPRGRSRQPGRDDHDRSVGRRCVRDVAALRPRRRRHRRHHGGSTCRAAARRMRASCARKFKGKAWKRDREVFEHRKRRVGVEAAELDHVRSEHRPRLLASVPMPTRRPPLTPAAACTWRGRSADSRRCGPTPTEGDARVVMVTSHRRPEFAARRRDRRRRPGRTPVDADHRVRRRQLMLVYYDVRETRAQNFGQFISDDGRASGTRQTMDIRAAMGTPGDPPASRRR